MQKLRDNSDSIRAHRRVRACVSTRFASVERQKLTALCSFATTKNGNSATAIVTALIRNEPLTARVDEIAFGLLGKNIGMWKLAASVFPRPLKIDSVIHAIEILRAKLLHGPTAPRVSNHINSRPFTGPYRMGFYLLHEDHQRLSFLASEAGISRSTYIRAAVMNKEITSRLSLTTANEIRETGLLVMSAIRAEQQRQADGGYGDSDGGILVLLNHYKKLLVQIREELK